ncbi:MAG: hypothetical protein ABFD62_04980 [Syntrophaceae bacterium]
MSGAIKIVRYDSLRACFLNCIDKQDLTDEEAKRHFWVGHNGKRGFRIRIDKWLARKEKVWGWANYKKRELHIYVAADADIFEVIALLSHELGHFQRPRYPFGHDEERKAEQYKMVTATAINMAKELCK